MLTNYLKIAFRNLRKQRGYALTNVVGLSIGLTCCLLIALYVRYEISYDRFHEDADRIHRINWISENPQTRTPHPMAQALVTDFPEVESAVSLTPIWGPGLTRPSFSVRYEDRQFEERGFLAVDSTFFDVFSFPVVKGNGPDALSQPFQLLITETVAEKYFGQADPLGKMLRINDQFELPVTAVLADVPPNSHFHFDFLLSYVTMKQVQQGSPFYEWGDFGHYNYVRLAEGVAPLAVENKISSWIGRYIDLSDEFQERLEARQVYFQVQPITDIHLHSRLRWELEPNSDITYIYSLTAAALFLLLIACVNFMNLATARSMDRAREVGMRKALGAGRLQLARQFLGESLMMSTLGMATALALVEVTLPFFNSVVGTHLYIPYFEDPWVPVLIVGTTIFVGLLAGSYPAFYLSAFQPTGVLKGTFKTSTRGTLLRKTLVVFQFTLSIGLIIGTLVIYNQVSFLRNTQLGFEEEQIVVMPMRDSTMQAQYETLKQELVTHPNVLHASAVSNVPGGRFNQNAIRWVDDDETYNASEWYIDYDMIETLGIEVIEGRSFSRDFPGDVGTAFLLNETAARQFEWDSAVNQDMVWYADPDSIRGTVVGVVKDFHFASLHQPVAPIIMQLSPQGFNYMMIKIRTERIDETLAFLEQQWQAFSPSRGFAYSFLNDDFDALYRSEERLGTIIGLFAGLAVFVAGLGLFGLAAFTAEQRTKEIGVRKALGASVGQIIILLSKDFTRLVLGALILAAPLAYLAMNRWLENFAFHIEISWGIFLAAGLAALGIALVTVGYQALRAALTDPVDCLRYE